MKSRLSLGRSGSLPEIFQEVGSVRSLVRFRPSIFSLTLELPEIASLAKPGQFLHLKVDRLAEVLLRRPFSIASVQGDLVELIIRVVGKGTAGLAELQEARLCDVLGPLGKGFDYEGVNIAYLVGGGIGVAPLLFLQDELNKYSVPVRFLVGSRTEAEFPLSEPEISARGVEPSTDDGSYGYSGFVTAGLEAALQEGVAPGAQVFSCGPVPMMKEVNRICREYGLPHQVSLENRMGCAIGVCQGCALQIGESSERGGFRLVCLDGPVFDARKVDWSTLI